ncbi:MAG TPA: hypothetical protein VFV55_00895 [Usitatibacteraceae bacterium]|nr:hypothetical protein [Usitatibacteraceae bacterium]
MKKVLRALFALAATLAVPCAHAASGIAFITDLKGEVAVDGTPRPLLLSELARGQRIIVGTEAQLAVMFIQSGKEYVLKGPADYVVGEREITATHGMPPAARETPWRASNQVLVKVAQTSGASIRMRSLAPVKSDTKPRLDFPTRGAVATLQPTLRWSNLPDGKVEVAIAVAGKEDKPLAKAKVSGGSHRFPVKLRPDTEYAWTVSFEGREIGSATFRTLPAAALQNAEQRRPSEKAEFSDRLLYALLLQEIGATQEAQEAWGKLAEERTDLPELAGLAK